MANQREFFNEEKGFSEMYTEVSRMEYVTVKDVKRLPVIQHYWKDSDGEEWVNFDDPSENIRIAFQAYRSYMGYMSPEDIKKLRVSMNLSLREFAKRLGMGYSTLSQIENDHRVQNSYQEKLFEFSKVLY